MTNSENLERIIRMKEVSHITGLSKSTIYQYMDEGKFPQSFSLGGQMRGWSLSSVSLWVRERINSNNED